ncbi:hypothetical protein MPTK1_2g21500 [Marchantia polymorpha subsp. ruderalis]|uniref:Uncharacterized protein n=1 Tax=Marchantia polymorpha TaxID=3197 RepID=A0A2R6X2Q6_MARPO|nr:hypothetical protein MARPO_0040s0064 [Marchantia polymorpha]BBN03193.1 hypothetical protein Mp_2g21500 [Marchantia polymorpha subsp. ruderalis]|eukprot:PTQ40384.1 hypothetical protein MARPO_0040s0064 [Marchantia polymorpha]
MWPPDPWPRATMNRWASNLSRADSDSARTDFGWGTSMSSSGTVYRFRRSSSSNAVGTRQRFDPEYEMSNDRVSPQRETGTWRRSLSFFSRSTMC